MQSHHGQRTKLTLFIRGGLWARYYLPRPMDLWYWLSLLPRPSRGLPWIVRVSERMHPSNAGCCWRPIAAYNFPRARMLVAKISLWLICAVIVQCAAQLRNRINDTSASDSHVMAGGVHLLSQPASQSHIRMPVCLGGAERMTTTAWHSSFFLLALCLRRDQSTKRRCRRHLLWWGPLAPQPVCRFTRAYYMRRRRTDTRRRCRCVYPCATPIRSFVSFCAD
jgi:hypothetical protein